MKNTHFANFIKGSKVIALFLIPIFILIYVIESLIIRNAIELIPERYNAGTTIFIVLIAGVFLATLIYWFRQKNWWALIGSVVGGGLIFAILVMLGIFLSCAQGSCF